MWGPDGFLPGEAHDRRFRVLGHLGDGGSAAVLQCTDSRQPCPRTPGRPLHVAVKVAKPGTREGSLVAREAKVLKLLGTTGCVPKVFHVDRAKGQQFIAMELCGKNLAEVQATPGRRTGGFGEALALEIGQHMLYCVAAVHFRGYIHRDIKPANFVVHHGGGGSGGGRGQGGVRVLLVDFGLARKYTMKGGGHQPERPEAEFRGSKSYASIAAHLGKDLSRRDDLWGVLFIMVELLHGQLPWREAGGRGESMTWEQVRELKELCMGDFERLTAPHSLPGPMLGMAEHLAGLGFADEPDYDYLMQVLSCGRVSDLSEWPAPLPADWEGRAASEGGTGAALKRGRSPGTSPGISIEGPSKRLPTHDLEERRLSSGDLTPAGRRTPSHPGVFTAGETRLSSGRRSPATAVPILEGGLGYLPTRGGAASAPESKPAGEAGRGGSQPGWTPEAAPPPAARPNPGATRQQLCITARENLCAVSLRDSYDVISDVMRRQAQRFPAGSEGGAAAQRWLDDLRALAASLLPPPRAPAPFDPRWGA